jgi:DMSO/TMAO reductase YedYZ molybdopterin-dependent catalytic subunit
MPEHARGNLPPGQRALAEFPRIGIPRMLARRVSVPDAPTLRIDGDVASPCEIPLGDLEVVPRRDQVSDFHCAATWSTLGLRWGGWAFRDVYEQLIAPRARPADGVRYMKFIGADGFYASLAVEFALVDGVLLADTLDGEPLPPEHGAPLRIVAPEHYGYKSVKHLCAIEVHRRYPSPFRGGGGLLAHRDALVEREQRSQLLPGPVYRRVYALGLPTALRMARWITRKRGIGS